MALTTRLSLPYPADADPADVPTWMRNLAVLLDDIVATDAQGPIASRPAAGRRGALYTSTNEGTKPVVYRDDGTAWYRLDSIDWKPGDIKFTSRDDLEAGFLWARGQNESRTTYADLWAEYGTRYGAGDGSTTFGMPDSRGRNLVGLDTGAVALAGAAALGAKGGAQSVLLTAAESGMRSHGHGISDPGHTHQDAMTSGAGAFTTAPLLAPHNNNIVAAWADAVATTGVTVQAAAASDAQAAHSNVQPFITVNVMVKY